MNPADWKRLSVVGDGAALDIEGVDVWWHEWRRLDIGTLTVRHPSHPHQRHVLRPYAIVPEDDPILFCAGELSNCVWCFHVPANGQPGWTCRGMTVNERLNASALSDAFDAAIRAGQEKRAQDILIATGLRPHQATETVAATLANPETYGF